MDTTRMEELLRELAAADPADAPDIADELTATLAAALDEPDTTPAGPGADSGDETKDGAP